MSRGQWNSPKTQSKTGGASWTPAAPASATAGFRPQMPGQQMPAAGAPGQPGQWSGGMPMTGNFPQQPMVKHNNLLIIVKQHYTADHHKFHFCT